MKILPIILLACSPAVMAGDRASAMSEAECMAVNVYHEARGQGTAGMIMVMDTVRNRVASRIYPNTVCEVVYQPWQFSWTRENVEVTNMKTYTKIMRLTNRYMNGSVKPRVRNSLYYHADYIKPHWANNVVQVAHINDHIFYKRKRR